MSNEYSLKFNNLEDTRLDLFNKLEALKPEVLTYKTNDNKWSADQTIFHLVKSEQLTSIAINRLLNQKDKLQNAGFTDLVRSKVLNIALRSKLKFKAPAATTTMPDKIDFKELKEKWETVRNSIKQIVEDYPIDFSNKRIMNHPKAGWLTMGQTLDFLQNHFDHHRTQIEDLITNFPQE